MQGAVLHVFFRPIRSDDDDQKIRPPMLAAAIIETYDAQNEASTTAGRLEPPTSLIMVLAQARIPMPAVTLQKRFPQRQ